MSNEYIIKSHLARKMPDIKVLINAGIIFGIIALFIRWGLTHAYV